MVGLADELTILPGAAFDRYDVSWDDAGSVQLFLPAGFSVAARYGLIGWLPAAEYSAPMESLVLHSPSLTGRWHAALTSTLWVSPGLALTYVGGTVGEEAEDTEQRELLDLQAELADQIGPRRMDALHDALVGLLETVE